MGLKTLVVPRHVQETSSWFSGSATMDEIDVAAVALQDTPAGVWARSVAARSVARGSDAVCMDGVVLRGEGHRGTATVTALTASAGMLLDEATAVSVQRMLHEPDITAVVLRPYAPVGFIRARYPSAPVPLVAAAADLPAQAVVAAIVDKLDKTAVIDLIAIAPGPVTFRRNDGQWVEDPGWVHVLKGVRPPPMVRLDDQAILDSVAQQVDEATSGVPFEPLDIEDNPLRASAVVAQIENEDAYAAIQLALLGAIDVGELKNPVATERLRKYWLTGKGAAKIRWGTPGAWTRCRRLLSKHMPPYMVPGYCTNLSQRLGGHGVATHVGTDAKRKIKRALT